MKKSEDENEKELLLQPVFEPTGIVGVIWKHFFMQKLIG